MTTAIARAAAALDDGDFAAALDALLAAWRALPDPALADAIDRVGARAGRDVPRPTGRTQAARDRAWAKLVAKGGPAARAAVHATLRDGDARLRIETLLGRDLPPPAPTKVKHADRRDPRLAAVLVDVLLRAPGAAYAAFATQWRALFAACSALGDARIAAHADALRERWRAMTRNGGAQGRATLVEVEAALAKVRALPAPRLPAADAARVAQIAAHPALVDARAGDEAALLAAVYADPASDGPRAVFADWLQERGDARGELIALQLKGGHANAVRAAALLRQHRDAWLGALAPHVHNVEFARGFPRSAHVRAPARPSAPPVPAWATLEQVSGDLPASDATPMPVLREAHEVAAPALVRLARLATPPPLEILELALPRREDVDAHATAKAIAALRLPHLKSLAFRGATWPLAPAQLPALLAISPVLDELGVQAPLETFGAWLAAASASRLPRLAFRPAEAFVPIACTRDRRGALTCLEVMGQVMTPVRGLVAFIGMLGALSAGTVGALAITRVDVRVWTVGMRKLMAAALASHPGIRLRGMSGYTPPK